MTRPLVTTIKAYAQLTRVSNLPTVMTNVLLGGVAGTVDATASVAPWPWARLAMVGAAVAGLYAGGMAMNDLVDAAFDRRQRPERPIPSGKVSPLGGWGFVVASLAVGEALLMALGAWPAVGGVCLIGAIVAYNLLHRAYASSVLLMGLCRGLVVVTAAATVMGHHPLSNGGVLGFAFLVAAYTAVLTLIARGENATGSSRAGRWWAMGLPLIALMGIGIARPVTWWPCAIAAMGLVLWLGHGVAMLWRVPPQAKQAVMVALAGFCLVDAYHLTLLDRPGLALLAGACFAMTAWTHRLIVGT